MKCDENELFVADLIRLNLSTVDKGYFENNDFGLIREVLLKDIKSGISGGIVITAIAHIPREIVANALGISVKNINQLAKRNLKIYQADALMDLSCVWYELRKFFSFDENSLREWICIPLPALAGITPALLLTSIAGRRELRVLLQTMRSCDF